METDLPLQPDFIKVLGVTQPGHLLYALALWLPGMQSVPLHSMGTGGTREWPGDTWGMDMAGLERVPRKEKETSFPLHTLKQQKALLFSSQLL